MDIWHFVVIFAILAILFLLTHLRPLNEREIQDLSNRRRDKEINRYFSFDMDEYQVDKEFKGRMNGDGEFYHIHDTLFEFPSVAAGLLKYKKHEWIIVAFEKHRTIDLLWVNKGPDRNGVSCALSAGKISQISLSNNYSSVLIFHNHPNPNPRQYDCSEPSEQDITSARSYSQILDESGINLVEFVCERGRHSQYFFSVADPFVPVQEFRESIVQKNDTSRVQNLLLHIERFL